jgi:hypothetical protein
MNKYKEFFIRAEELLSELQVLFKDKMKSNTEDNYVEMIFGIEQNNIKETFGQELISLAEVSTRMLEVVMSLDELRYNVEKENERK